MSLFKRTFLGTAAARFIMKKGLLVCLVLAVCTTVVYLRALPLCFNTYDLYQSSYEMLIGLFGCLLFTLSACFITSLTRK